MNAAEFTVESHHRFNPENSRSSLSRSYKQRRMREMMNQTVVEETPPDLTPDWDAIAFSTSQWEQEQVI